MVKTKREIRKLSLEELTLVLQQLGEPKFRAKQIYEWLWQKGASGFVAMTNLSKELRKKLEDEFEIFSITIDTEQKSIDGTIKCRFKLHDDHFIEGVLIPTETRMTACVSSQVGCNLGCKFCATGYMKTKRNLEPYEIYDQVFLLNAIAEKNYDKHLSNIVFMGMGEPLLNYKNVLLSIERITGEDGMAMSPRRITVSTAGLAKMIRKLADDKVKFNLALSLHAADDIKRSELMPINDSNNLTDLVQALNYFYDRTKNVITFEYILFDGINESLTDAKNLVKLCRQTNAKVNIIEYNTIQEADFHKSKKEQRENFIAYLEDQGVVAIVRRSRGKDIDAACGQLANK
ncbi:MAG: 23S rRNA (adenine(2503)-C(2))-methyltransferase RlmN [Fimbriimonadaceae bacterium]|nr:23S rRNA (adenine(2503)-C(2))-methyltransferase RlmN [Chitinophagales bacterium]